MSQEQLTVRIIADSRRVHFKILVQVFKNIAYYITIFKWTKQHRYVFF